MRIYTYYENLDNNNFQDQEKLIELWKKSWSRKGFEPFVLNKSDADKCLQRNSFEENIKNTHVEITGKKISKYGLSCYNRWFAYSKVDSSEPFYVSDYDVINNNYHHDFDYNDNLFFLDGSCPCFAFGKNYDYERFILSVLEILNEYTERYKLLFEGNRWLRYLHDQEFLDLTFSERIRPKENPDYFNELAKPLKEKYLIHMTRNRPSICGPIYRDSDLNNKIIHFSHDSVNKFKSDKEIFKSMNCDQVRFKLISDLISNDQQ